MASCALGGAFGRVAADAHAFKARSRREDCDPSDNPIHNSPVKKVSKVGVRDRIEIFHDVDI